MQSNKILKVIAIAFDAIFSIPLLTFIASCWWMYLDARNSTSQHINGAPVFIMVGSGILTIFGLPWDWFRFGRCALNKYPNLGPYMQIFMFIIVAAIGLPLILMSKLGR